MSSVCIHFTFHEFIRLLPVIEGQVALISRSLNHYNAVIDMQTVLCAAINSIGSYAGRQTAIDSVLSILPNRVSHYYLDKVIKVQHHHESKRTLEFGLGDPPAPQ